MVDVINLSIPVIQSYLVGLNYPATKDSIIKQAQVNKATPEVIAILNQLPKSSYNSRDEIIPDIKIA